MAISALCNSAKVEIPDLASLTDLGLSAFFEYFIIIKLDTYSLPVGYYKLGKIKTDIDDNSLCNNCVFAGIIKILSPMTMESLQMIMLICGFVGTGYCVPDKKQPTLSRLRLMVENGSKWSKKQL